MKKHCWVFTINNYTEGDKPFVVTKSQEGWVTRHLQWKDAGYVYIGYGMEVSSTGTPHLQGTVIFKRSVSFKTLKNISPKAHWEVMRGTIDEALDYCKKDGQFEAYVSPAKGSLQKETSRRWELDRQESSLKTEEGARVSDVLESLAELKKEVQRIRDSQKQLSEAVVRIYAKQNSIISQLVDIQNRQLVDMQNKKIL